MHAKVQLQTANATHLHTNTQTHTHTYTRKVEAVGAEDKTKKADKVKGGIQPEHFETVLEGVGVAARRDGYEQATTTAEQLVLCTSYICVVNVDDTESVFI